MLGGGGGDIPWLKGNNKLFTLLVFLLYRVLQNKLGKSVALPPRPAVGGAIRLCDDGWVRPLRVHQLGERLWELPSLCCDEQSPAL